MDRTDYSKYTVLIVDDIPVNILLVKGMLSKQKFNIISADSGQHAIDLLSKTSPDLILMDILMPGMNGFDTIRIIRANPETKDIPIIILSALNSDTDIKEGLEAGADEFITKPIIQEQIVNSVIKQIKLSESNKIKQQAEVDVRFNTDATIRLLAYMSCGKLDALTASAVNVALSVPLTHMDESFYELSDYSQQGVSKWVMQCMQGIEVKYSQLSIKDCLHQCVNLLRPAAARRNLSWEIRFATDMEINADVSLLKAVFINLLSYACQTATGEIHISGTMDGGLANIVITFLPETATGNDVESRVALALEVALKMNGTVMFEHANDGRYVFRLLFQR